MERRFRRPRREVGNDRAVGADMGPMLGMAVADDYVLVHHAKLGFVLAAKDMLDGLEECPCGALAKELGAPHYRVKAR